MTRGAAQTPERRWHWQAQGPRMGQLMPSYHMTPGRDPHLIVHVREQVPHGRFGDLLSGVKRLHHLLRTGAHVSLASSIPDGTP